MTRLVEMKTVIMMHQIWQQHTRRVLAGAVGAALLILTLFVFSGGRGDTQYRTGEVAKGPLTITVSSSGSLQAVVTVAVSSQISGQIKELPADFNTQVTKDQIIARLDPATYEARVNQAEADYAAANAQVSVADAAIVQARIAQADAERVLARSAELKRNGNVSQAALDTAQTAVERTRAQVISAQAAADAARATVKLKAAALQSARVDLARTIIRSPVNGVVIDRAVDIGQTVAASLQAPTLFTIAEDLSQMQVKVSVDEADIGRIDVGQSAVFTVDSFPGREFRGKVEQIRKAATTVSNVVTYAVVVSADNSELKLLPGMTANVKIVVEDKPDALKIPAAALRFRPEGAQAPAQAGEALAAQRPAGAGGGAAGGAGPGAGTGGGPGERAREILEQLELTAEQKAKITPVFQGLREEMAALRGKGLAPEEMRGEFRRIMETRWAEVRPLLTEPQREKLAALTGGRERGTPATVWVLEGSKLAPVRIVTGASDGTITEVLRGDLAPGQKIVTGIQQSPADGRRAAMPPMRF